MASMGLATTLLIILTIDAAFFIGQAAVKDINPDGAPIFLNNSYLSSVDKGGYVLDQENALDRLPQGSPTVNPDTGNLFTDTFTSAWNWFADNTGINFLFSFLAGPYSYVASATPDTPIISFTVGAIWMLMTLFLIVAFLLGRNT